jgi:hypothetical protein
MNHECFECTDYLEQDAICYVCYQQMERKIETLEAKHPASTLALVNQKVKLLMAGAEKKNDTEEFDRYKRVYLGLIKVIKDLTPPGTFRMK